jgi:hypothetical protein
MKMLEGGASYKSFGTSALERMPVIASPYVRLCAHWQLFYCDDILYEAVCSIQATK